MATYVALLRGINVGNNILKMERLRELWAELGFTNARTYIQSGSIVFEAEGAPSVWASAIEQKLVGETRLPISVILRTSVELGRIIGENPFLKDEAVDRSKLHVTFVGDAIGKDAIKKLVAIRSEGDECRVLGREIFVHCPNGYGRTKLSNQMIEKALSMKATTRNWNTVNKLYAMAQVKSGDEGRSPRRN